MACPSMWGRLYHHTAGLKVYPDLPLIEDHLIERAAGTLGIAIIIAGHIHRSVVLTRTSAR